MSGKFPEMSINIFDKSMERISKAQTDINRCLLHSCVVTGSSSNEKINAPHIFVAVSFMQNSKSHLKPFLSLNGSKDIGKFSDRLKLLV